MEQKCCIDKNDSAEVNFLSHIKPSPVLTHGWLYTFHKPSFTKSIKAKSFWIKERREIMC